LFLRIFFTRTGVHFAGKCSNGKIVREAKVLSEPDAIAGAAFFVAACNRLALGSLIAQGKIGSEE
jgi:hypothetical protein